MSRPTSSRTRIQVPPWERHRVGDFVLGFVEVDVHVRVDLVRQHGHPSQPLGVDGVGGMGTETGGDQCVASKPVVERETPS